jgi:hypothetical protein
MTLTIRGIPEKVYYKFTDVAKRNHRNAEAHGRWLIHREAEGPAETGEDLLTAYAELPPPDVDVSAIERLQTSRGRRSNRS